MCDVCYRREPNQLHRLVPWLNRELQVLLQNNVHHIPYVMRVIMDCLVRHDLRSPEFRDAVRPYFHIHADHFVHELANYARTRYDLIGYDQYVTYAPTQGLYTFLLPSLFHKSIQIHFRNLLSFIHFYTSGLSNEYVPLVTSPSSSGSSTSNDSDVQVVDETIDPSRLNNEMPGVGPHTVDMPGIQFYFPYTFIVVDC